MARKFGAKTTHHCWCGTTGYCRKHFERCNKHQVDYYADGGCMGCNNEARMQAQREANEKRAQKEAEERKKKIAEDEASYGQPSKTKKYKQRKY